MRNLLSRLANIKIARSALAAAFAVLPGCIGDPDPIALPPYNIDLNATSRSRTVRFIEGGEIVYYTFTLNRTTNEYPFPAALVVLGHTPYGIESRLSLGHQHFFDDPTGLHYSADREFAESDPDTHQVAATEISGHTTPNDRSDDRATLYITK